MISKFADHDIVFLGEYHRIKHDVELVQQLIPALYRAGVFNLGIEFALYADQPEIDSMLTAPSYDSTLAAKFLWNQWPWWGFQEYADLFKTAWELNHTLPNSARKFRIVGLNTRADWSLVWSEADRQNPEIMKRVWKNRDGDEYMASVILNQFVAKQQKALIYSGINHAYTKYQQPVYNLEKKKLVSLLNRRMGNFVFAKIGERCCTIFLHSPWPSVKGYSKPFVYPVDGIIDALFAELGSDYYPVGFDSHGTPFGRLPSTTSYWKHGYPDFTLEQYCEGYIFCKPLSRYQGVSVIKNWFTAENRLEAIAQIANPDPRVKDTTLTVSRLYQGLKQDTDFRRRFRIYR
ncbi:MAG: hypothetical protein Kow0042_20590 [Calditrichia bacterium]